MRERIVEAFLVRADLRAEVGLAQRDAANRRVRRDLERMLHPDRGLDHGVHFGQRRNVVGTLDLRNEHAGQRERGNRREIVVVAGVDTHVHRLPPRRAEQVGEVAARLDLRRRGHAVLEVDDHGVGTRRDRLLDAVGAMSRSKEPGERRRVHTTPSRRSRSSSAPPIPTSASTPAVCAPSAAPPSGAWTCAHFFDVDSGARLDPDGARKREQLS